MRLVVQHGRRRRARSASRLDSEEMLYWYSEKEGIVKVVQS